MVIWIQINHANIEPSPPQRLPPQLLIRIPSVHVGYPTLIVDPSPDVEPGLGLCTCATSFGDLAQAMRREHPYARQTLE